MALFKGIRDKLGAVSQALADANAASEAAAEAANPIVILNPSPQEEVDRLLAADGLARGVVVRATHKPLDDGERVHRLKVKVRVRPRLANGDLGEQSTVDATVSWKVSVLLDRGLEIPVLLDRTTGVVTAIPVDELTKELEPRFDESDKRGPGWSFEPF